MVVLSRKLEPAGTKNNYLLIRWTKGTQNAGRDQKDQNEQTAKNQTLKTMTRKAGEFLWGTPIDAERDQTRGNSPSNHGMGNPNDLPERGSLSGRKGERGGRREAPPTPLGLPWGRGSGRGRDLTVRAKKMRAVRCFGLPSTAHSILKFHVALRCCISCSPLEARILVYSLCPV